MTESTQKNPGNDAKWKQLNQELLSHIKNGDWGLYRNARFQMAEILEAESRLQEALETYLEVFYLDLNGLSNLGGRRDPEYLREFPAFDPKSLGFIAPGIKLLIGPIIQKLDLEKVDLELIFLRHNSRFGKKIGLPLPAEDAWASLEKILF